MGSAVREWSVTQLFRKPAVSESTDSVYLLEGEALGSIPASWVGTDSYSDPDPFINIKQESEKNPDFTVL
jgi:hypothetical protein